MKMKLHLLNTLFIIFALNSNAQSFDEDRIVLSQFIERLYNNAPFEGCRIIDDYDNSYLLSVVALDASNYKTSSALNRVAQVKSQRNAGEFFNGTQSISEFVVKTTKGEKQGKKANVISETFEMVKSNSTGFVQQMQLLTTFDNAEQQKVFVFYKELSAKRKAD